MARNKADKTLIEAEKFKAVVEPPVAEYSNYDLDNIITPVKPKMLQQLLLESGYDENKTKYLVDGFTKGFSLNYQGPLEQCKRT